MCGISQTSQSHPPLETKGHLTLLILQSLPTTAPGGSLCPQVQLPCGPVWHAMSSSPKVRVTDKLLSISSVQRHVFHHPRPSLINRVNRT